MPNCLMAGASRSDTGSTWGPAAPASNREGRSGSSVPPIQLGEEGRLFRVVLDLALFGFDRLFGFRVDPPRIEADAVFRRDLGAAELVPIGNARHVGVVMRDHVVSPLQHAIERAGAGDKRVAVDRKSV